MISKIILNFLGVMIYFLSRFSARKNQGRFNPKFWLKDNWEELTIIGLVDISIMILLLSNDISLTVTEFLPDWVASVGDLTIAWLLGLGLASVIYNIIQKKINTVV